MKEEFYISLIGEAFDGYTEFTFKDKPVFVKHVTIRDQRYLHKYYEKYKDKALAKGVESEKDRIKYILDEGLWDQEDDLKIQGLEFEVENLKRTVNQLLLGSQRDQYRETIKEKTEELISLKSKRKEVIGKTAEDYASGRSGDEILRFLLFKNRDLTEHLYTEDEFDDLEAWEVAKLAEAQADIQKRLSDERIQEAVLRPFFTMYLSMCEDTYGFYRKAVTELSIFQLRVVIFGRMFFNIFQFTEDIPDSIRQDPEKLLAYSESKRNNSSDSKAIRDDAAGSAVFGATKQDIKDLDGSRG